MVKGVKWSWIDVWQSTNQIAFVFTVGATFGLLGPSLIDLAELHSTTPDKEAMTNAARAIGMFLSSCSGSLIYKYANDQVMMMVTLFIFGAATVVIPFLPNITYVYVITFGAGLAEAVSHTGSQLRLVRIWKGQSASALQAFSTAYGTGAMVAPTICAPFLSLREGGHVIKEAKMYIPYTVVLGSLFLLVLLSKLAAFYVDPSGIEDVKKEDSDPDLEVGRTSEIILVILLLSYITMLMNDQIAFSTLISWYSIMSPNLHFSKAEAAYLASAFWSTVAFGRFTSIFALMVFNIKRLLLISHSFSILGSVILIVFRNSALCTWLGAALMGLGFSPLLGAGSGLVFQYLNVKHFHVSVVVNATCLGTAIASYVVPPILKADPMFLQYYVGLGNVAHLSILLITFCVIHGKQTMNEKREESQGTPAGA